MKKILTVTLNPAIDYTVDVPNFKIDHVNRASGGRRDPGGKGVNVATAAAKFNVPTSVTGFLGLGNAAIFREHFNSSGINDCFVYTDGNTREGIKITDSGRQITTDINFPGFRLPQKDIDVFLDKFDFLLHGFDYIIISGSLPEGLASDFYGELVKRVGQNAFIAVDAAGEPLVRAVDTGAVNLIKPNIHEIIETFGDGEQNGESPLAAADRLCKRLLEKVGMIALSMGEAGSRLYTREGVFEASAPPITVASTVGAGDSFLGGLIAGLARERPHDEALRLAAATAAAKLTIFGPGWSDENPPGKFYDLITIKRL